MKKGPKPKSIIERALSHIIPEPNSGCWLWDASLDSKGYGQINTKTNCAQKMRRVHIVIYQHFVGPIPVGMDIDHKCRVRSCVNPDHLRPMTRAENVSRRLPFIRNGKTVIPTWMKQNAS